MTKIEKVTRIVTAFNAATDLPVFGEKTEQKLFMSTLGKVLETAVPDVVLDALMHLDNGLDDKMLDSFAGLLTEQICAKINTPWIPNVLEETLVRQGVNLLLSKAKEGLAILAA